MKNIKSKIIGVVGVVIIASSLGGLFLYRNEIANNSELFEKKVIVVKHDIKKGDKITNDNIQLTDVKKKDLSTGYLTEKDMSKLNNKVAAIDLYKNEQIKTDRLVDYETYYPEESQEISLSVDTISALSAEIQPGDYVSLWDKGEGNTPVKVLSNVEVVAIKDSQNIDVTTDNGGVPYSVIVRLDNDKQVAVAKDIKDLFITKNPNQITPKK